MLLAGLCLIGRVREKSQGVANGIIRPMWTRFLGGSVEVSLARCYFPTRRRIVRWLVNRLARSSMTARRAVGLEIRKNVEHFSVDRGTESPVLLV